MRRSIYHNLFCMQPRISHMLFACLVLLACSVVSARTHAPAFPPDPGSLYVPPVVIVMGDTVKVDNPEDTTLVQEIDVRGDSTIMYNTQENVLTLNSAALEAGDSLTAAISYSGTDTLYIILCDTSHIIADTVISSQSDIVIKGEGTLRAEGDVPIIGAPTASILFDSVTMYVRSLKGPAAVRRRVRGIKQVDEDGGPALSGFSTVDYNKTSVTPPDADYGEVEVSDSEVAGAPTRVINALYVVRSDGSKVALTEFQLTAIADLDPPDALENADTRRQLDPSQPMYNILGVQVDASYRGIVLQNGRKYMRN